MQNKRQAAGLAGVALAAALMMVLGVVSAGARAAGETAVRSRQTIVETVRLAPTQDNTLYESEAGNISNGAGEYLFAGQTQRGELRRGLLAFDLSAIPPSATVISATLTLTMSKTIAGETPVTLHAAAAAWGEGASDALGDEGAGAAAEPGDATWRYRFFSSDAWAAPGGDFAAGASAMTPVAGSGAYTWAGAGLTADVAAWVRDPASNFGWVLLGDETAPTTAKRFDSRENAPENRPLLVVVYAVGAFRAWTPVVVGAGEGR
jgi:hypothetical protein